MPKLIDYPRTSYVGAWELSEIVDDTGGKCSVETAARKLNRKVSGSFKAIIGSAVKFGLMTSKRELLSTTTLFRRIKHAYDKAEELQFHREAFLTPPLFTQICRKFRSRELPVQMLDVMLIREFGVEEINAQNVAKAFVDGCRMCGLIDEHNIIADIDALNNRAPRRALANTGPELSVFAAPQNATPLEVAIERPDSTEIRTHQDTSDALGLFRRPDNRFIQTAEDESQRTADSPDPVANLFGLDEPEPNSTAILGEMNDTVGIKPEADSTAVVTPNPKKTTPLPLQPSYRAEYAADVNKPTNSTYQMQMSGPGVNTALDITEEADIDIAVALLEKIRRQLRASA